MPITRREFFIGALSAQLTPIFISARPGLLYSKALSLKQVLIAGCLFEITEVGSVSNVNSNDTSGSTNESYLLVSRSAIPVVGASSVLVKQRFDSRIESIATRDAGASKNDAMRVLSRADEAATIQNPRIHVIRPQDRLDLVFDFFNLQIVARSGYISELVRIDPGKKAIVSITFPGQHLRERAFFAGEAGSPSTEPLPLPPVAVRLSEESRLSFTYSGLDPIPLSIETLLDWRNFEPNLVFPVRPYARIAKPLPHETSISIPAGLYLSPVGRTEWTHSPKPRFDNGRAELWHTTLLRSTEGMQASDPPERFVRFVWTPSYSNGIDADPFDSPISDKLRRELVRLTHDATTPVPVAVRANQLQMSSLGANFSFDGRFPYSCETGSPLSVFAHDAELGQDSRVEFQLRGYLYPTGHPAVLQTVTTRELVQEGGPSAGAYLRKRKFCVVSEKTVVFAQRNDSWATCFASLTIDTRSTPPLDLPLGIPKQSGGTWDEEAFWPKVADKLFYFELVGEDWEGVQHRFRAPLVFLTFDAKADNNIPSDTEAYVMRLKDVQTDYLAWPDRSEIAFDGRPVAISQSSISMRTTLHVTRLVLNAELVPTSICPQPHPQFNFITPSLQALVPVLKQIVADEENTTWYRLADQALTQAGVFAIVDENRASRDIRVGLGGQTERAGVITAPSITVAALSIAAGPIGGKGSPDLGNKVDSLSHFDLDANLFGNIKLKDVVPSQLPFEDAQVPAFITEIIDPADAPSVLSQSLSWETRALQSWPTGRGDAIFLAQQDAGDDSLFAEPGVPTSLYVVSDVRQSNDESAPSSFEVHSALRNFTIQMLFGGNNGIRLKCRSLMYSLDISGRQTIAVDIDSLDLVGPLLAFIKAFQSLLSSILGDSGIKIFVKPMGMEIVLPEYNLESISLGAMNIENLYISGGMTVSFRSEPMEFYYFVCLPERPFRLQIGIYEGGGSLLIRTDGRRITTLSISFHFGVAGTLDVGVAKGTASVVAGLQYLSSSVTQNSIVRTKIEYVFFVHASGSIRALSCISLSVDLHVSMVLLEQAGSSRGEGRVRATYSIRVSIFTKEFSFVYTKRISGSGGGAGLTSLSQVEAPKLKDYFNEEQWIRYCRAFA